MPGWGRGALATSSKEGAENHFGLRGISSTSRSAHPILSIRPHGGDSSVTDLLQSKEESLDDANISGGWTGFTGTVRITPLPCKLITLSLTQGGYFLSGCEFGYKGN